MRTSAAAFAAAVVLAGCGGANRPASEEAAKAYEPPAKTFPENKRIDSDGEYPLPAPPDEAALVRLTPSGTAESVIELDRGSLTVGADRVIRYTLVVTSSQGARNVLHEAMSCRPLEWKLVAVGRSDGSWIRPRESAWQPVERQSYNGTRHWLAKKAFCETTSLPSRDAERILQRIRETEEIGKIDDLMR
jgi:hypothetical protein